MRLTLAGQFTLPAFTTEFKMDSLKSDLDHAAQRKVVKSFDAIKMT